MRNNGNQHFLYYLYANIYITNAGACNLCRRRVEGRFPVFRGWDDLEASLNRAMDDYKNGRCKPWDEAFADIKARYST